jgi:hypothetical protein
MSSATTEIGAVKSARSRSFVPGRPAGAISTWPVSPVDTESFEMVNRLASLPDVSSF